MNIQCPTSQPCIDGILSNYSAEEPDRNIRVGYWSFYDFPRIRGTPDDPTQVFTSLGCVAFCESAVSQEDANLCAARQATQCDYGHDTPGTPTPTFTNVIYGFTAQCPGGTQTFTYFVPANTFTADSQEQADAMAQSYVARVARLHLICLSDLSEPEACLGSLTALTGQATCAGTITNWSVSGNLPPGLHFTTLPDSLNRRFAIAGTPSAVGSYSFTITAQDGGGGYMTRTYTVCILDITNSDPLPDATIGTAYTVNFAASVCAGAVLNWQVESGTLPPGLTLDEDTGVLSGTPTGLPMGYQFVVTVETPYVICQKTFTIDTVSGCVDWDLVTWSPATIQSGGTLILTPTFIGGYYHIVGTGYWSGNPGYVSDAIGTVNYAGAGCNAKAVVNVILNSNSGVQVNLMGFSVRQDGVLIANWKPPGGFWATAATATINFTIAPSAGSVITIHPYYGSAPAGDKTYLFWTPNSPSGDVEFDVTFSNLP